LFSAVNAAFIVRITLQLQQDPANLGISLARRIFFANLTITLFVAFIAVFGKRWLLRHTRITSCGSVADRGKELHLKIVGLEKRWGFLSLVRSLPIALRFTLGPFAAALAVYHQYFTAIGQVALLISMNAAFCACIVACRSNRLKNLSQ